MNTIVNMDAVISIVDKTVDSFLISVKKSLEKNEYYIDSFHRSQASFGLVNNLSNEVCEQIGEMGALEYYIRDDLVNPLLFALFYIHGYKPRRAEDSRINQKNGRLSRASNDWYEKTNYYQMTFRGNALRPYALKYTEEELFNPKFRRHSLLLEKIYILDWNQDGHVTERLFYQHAKTRFENKIERISLLDLFELYFTKDEYDYCVKRMRDAITEANNIIGFDSIHMLTTRYMHEIKKNIRDNLLSWDLQKKKFHFVEYDNSIRCERIVEKDILPLELSNDNAKSDVVKIIENCYDRKRYEALMGTGEYAKCFLTSEYLYQLFQKGIYNMEYTAVACGYFKCVEQLTYRIVKIFLESGCYGSEIIKGVPQKYKKIQKQYRQRLDQMHETHVLENNMVPFQIQFEKAFDIMLNPLIFFIERVTSFWAVSVETQKHICKLLHNYADHCRNEHFHKDNIFDFKEIIRIRENTITLSLLLLGALKFPDEINEKKGLFIYDDIYDGLVEMLMKRRALCIYYLQFDNEIIKAHRYYYGKPIETDENGNLSKNEFEFVPVDGIEEIFQNTTDEQYNKWFSNVSVGKKKPLRVGKKKPFCVGKKKPQIVG